MAKKPNFALYIEMHKDTRGAQLIITPPIEGVTFGTVTKARMFARKISADHPRRSWNTYNTRAEYNPQETMFVGMNDLIIQSTAPTLENINELLHGYIRSGWKLTAPPIVVEMSYDDERDVEDAKAPAALIRRITRARQVANYPETVWQPPMKTVEEQLARIIENIEAAEKASTMTASRMAELTGTTFMYPAQTTTTTASALLWQDPTKN